MNKRINFKKMSFIFVVALLLSSTFVCNINAFSGPNSNNSAEIQQLILAQEEFIQTNQYLTDQGKIENIIKEYFYGKNEDYKSDGDIDISSFLDSSKDNKINYNKIININKFEKEVRKRVNGKIIWDNLNVSINNINVVGNTAKATVYENYEYVLDDYSNGYSSRGINYNIDMVKFNDKWLISQMESDNELEKGFLGNYENVNMTLNKLMESFVIPLNSEQLAKEKIIESQSINKAPPTSIQQSQNESIIAPQSLIAYTYNRSSASTYAMTYANNSGSVSDYSPYNNRFPNYNPNDCQNFGSQCVWYGFGGLNDQTSINNKLKPMVSSGDRAWYQTGTQYDTPSTWTWTGVSYFANYISSGSFQVQGPSGIINTGNLNYADFGDLIQISDGSSWYHTYVVNMVSGSLGTRTNSDIWVCAHTSNRQNVRLDTIIGSSQANTRNIRIGYAYYN